MDTDSPVYRSIGEILEEGLKNGTTQEDGYQGYITSKAHGDRLRQRYEALRNGKDYSELKHPNSMDDLPKTDAERKRWRKNIYEAITDYSQLTEDSEEDEPRVPQAGTAVPPQTPATKKTGAGSPTITAVEGCSPDSISDSSTSETSPVAHATGKMSEGGNQADSTQASKKKKKKDNSQILRVKALKPLEVELIAHEILVCHFLFSHNRPGMSC